jgi:hypothetical protein
MLLSMNFVELWRSPICLDGSTSIQQVWKQKVENSHYVPHISGSLRIWRLDPGILTWMQNRLEPWKEDL